MCDIGTCRPCRLEDLALDKAMGTTRAYIKAPHLSREETEARRKVINTNPLEGVRRKHISDTKEAQRNRDRAALRKEARILVDGRPVSIPCPEHGKVSGYNAWYCRCIPCTEAYSKAKKGKAPVG